MHRFGTDDGMTLVEQLVIIALVGVYLSIAFTIAGPGLWTILHNAEGEAQAKSSEAVANFVKQYANFTLTQDGPDIVAATDDGTEVARITGTL